MEYYEHVMHSICISKSLQPNQAHTSADYTSCASVYTGCSSTACIGTACSGWRAGGATHLARRDHTRALHLARLRVSALVERFLVRATARRTGTGRSSSSAPTTEPMTMPAMSPPDRPLPLPPPPELDVPWWRAGSEAVDELLTCGRRRRHCTPRCCCWCWCCGGVMSGDGGGGTGAVGGEVDAAARPRSPALMYWYASTGYDRAGALLDDLLPVVVHGEVAGAGVARLGGGAGGGRAGGHSQRQALGGRSTAPADRCGCRCTASRRSTSSCRPAPRR